MAYDLAAYSILDAPPNPGADTMSVEAAYRVAAAGSLQSVRAALEVVGRRQSTQRTLLLAAADLLSGQVPRAMRVLEDGLEPATANARPFLIDILAPLYVMSNQLEELEDLVETVPEDHPIALGIAALRVVRDARKRHRSTVHADIDDLANQLGRFHDDLLTGKVAQRLALAAYYTKRYELAISFAEQSVQAFVRLQAPRLAVTPYSIIYNVHHAVTGDCLAALRAAEIMTDLAKAAADRSYLNIGLVAQYEIAAEMGDSGRLHALRLQIRREAVPEQFRERFACRVADFLPFAWEDNFEALRAGMSIARDALRLTPPMRALATALMALADCALGNAADSRRLSRAAISQANLDVRENETAYDCRYRLLARALAGSSCVLLGATHRGHRALDGKAFAKDEELAVFIAVAQGRDYRELSIRNRGFGRAIQATRDRVLKCRSRVDLTRAEQAVLRMLAEGMTAPQIANQTGRSVSTVRNHTRSIIDKFDVSGRVAALSHARKLGLLE